MLLSIEHVRRITGNLKPFGKRTILDMTRSGDEINRPDVSSPNMGNIHVKSEYGFSL